MKTRWLKCTEGDPENSGGRPHWYDIMNPHFQKIGQESLSDNDQQEDSQDEHFDVELEIPESDTARVKHELISPNIDMSVSVEEDSEGSKLLNRTEESDSEESAPPGRPDSKMPQTHILVSIEEDSENSKLERPLNRTEGSDFEGSTPPSRPDSKKPQTHNVPRIRDKINSNIKRGRPKKSHTQKYQDIQDFTIPNKQPRFDTNNQSNQPRFEATNQSIDQFQQHSVPPFVETIRIIMESHAKEQQARDERLLRFLQDEGERNRQHQLILTQMYANFVSTNSNNNKSLSNSNSVEKESLLHASQQE